MNAQATLWHQTTNGLSNYQLASLTDRLLLELQASTLSVPANLRTREDHRLLDRIGRHWRARKGPGLR